MAKMIHGERVGKHGRLAVGCSASIFDLTRQKILLIRRTDNSRWSVPGGYMEPGESVAEACAREVWEETGPHVRVGRLISVYSTPHILLEYSDGNRIRLVILHFEAEPTEGELCIGGETTEIGYFALADTEQMEIGEMDRLRIADAFAAQTATMVR
jgi:ADP-ribose pyrophosphatase YjhB (NUDIX family)